MEQRWQIFLRACCMAGWLAGWLASWLEFSPGPSPAESSETGLASGTMRVHSPKTRWIKMRRVIHIMNLAVSLYIARSPSPDAFFLRRASTVYFSVAKFPDGFFLKPDHIFIRNLLIAVSVVNRALYRTFRRSKI